MRECVFACQSLRWRVCIYVYTEQYTTIVCDRTFLVYTTVLQIPEYKAPHPVPKKRRQNKANKTAYMCANLGLYFYTTLPPPKKFLLCFWPFLLRSGVYPTNKIVHCQTLFLDPWSIVESGRDSDAVIHRIYIYICITYLYMYMYTQTYQITSITNLISRSYKTP